MRRGVDVQSHTTPKRRPTAAAQRLALEADLSRPQRWLIYLGEAILFFIVAAAVLWPAPIHSNELPAAFAQSDVMISHWPSALLIKRTVAAEHRLPLWNPFYGGGRPLAADPLAAMFYPPTQLVNLFPIRDYYMVLLIGHLMLAGVGTLLLARRAFGLSRWASMVAAVSFMATPRLISHLGAGHVTLVQVVCWYPWLALGAWATVRRPRRWAAPFAVVLALAVLAGHPQMAYYGMLMTGVVVLWLLLQRYRVSNWRNLRAPLVGLAAAGAIALMLAAVHLLPLIEFTARSTRQDSVAATDRYPILVFLRALLGHPPVSSVPWENVIDPGGLVLMLAIFGAIAAGRRVLPLLGGIILVALLAMGNASPVFLLAAHVLPDFNRFHGLSRIWLVALLGIALLAGIGTEALLGLLRGLDLHKVRRGRLAVGLFTLLLVTATLIKTDQGRAQVSSVTPSITPTPLEKTVSQLAGSSRVYGVQRNLDQLSAVTLNTRFADGWDPLLIETYVKFMQQAGGYTFHGYQLTIPPVAGQPNAKLLGMMNVGIVVSTTKLKDPKFTLIKTMDKTLIYRNTANAGPAFLVPPTANGGVPTLAQAQPQTNGVSVTRLSREEDQFSVKTSATAYIVVADPAYPGWKAKLDGKPVSIARIDNALPAIKVSPGTHTLVYYYAPTSVYVGAAFSGLGVVLVLGGLILAWTRWREEGLVANDAGTLEYDRETSADYEALESPESSKPDDPHAPESG